MNVHEYQAKKILARYDIPIPRGGVVTSAAEAEDVARHLDAERWAIKAQVYAGGRSAGYFAGNPSGPGGVRLVNSVQAVHQNVLQMLGDILITEQTGAIGREVDRVYVEQAHELERELYLGMLVDRSTSRVTLISSAAGGVDIENVAAEAPGSIRKTAIDPLLGLDDASIDEVVADFELAAAPRARVVKIITTLYRMFVELDLSLIEINPLGITSSGEVLALDAVMSFDDNALYRHEDVRSMRDVRELRVGELEASHHGFNYVKLDGNIGCMASGAGLAMATLDAITYLGGAPANFLDIPPTAQVDRVKDALKLMLSDPAADCILINVFGGGIMRCDTIADGILLASREISAPMPLIVRLAGTNARLAQQRLRDSGPAIIFASDMADGAEKAVNAARQSHYSARKSWWQRAQQLLSRDSPEAK